MQEFSTPMMKQYYSIKEQFADCLLFFRMGDFYELFLEDARIGAQVLNITLTSKAGGKDGKIPMAGVPYHAVDSYLTKLVKAGFKVAICEQVSLPNKYGLVDREVVRVVTPGTVLDEKALDKSENNFIITVAIEGDTFALAASDLSTGFFGGMQKTVSDTHLSIKEELSRIRPVECILSESCYNNPDILKLLKSENNLNVFPYPEWDANAGKAERILKDHFKVSTLNGFEISGKAVLKKALASLLGYLKQTQKSNVGHIRKISRLDRDEHVVLDNSTVINLELFSTIREHDTRGSLLNVLDQTETPMGGRLLKQWLLQPLKNAGQINLRHDAVEFFLENAEITDRVKEKLKQIPDIERLVSRLSVGLGNARDLINLKLALLVIHSLKKELSAVDPELIRDSVKLISPGINKIIELIVETIVEEPPIDTKNGGMIRPGINQKLDTLRKTVEKSRNWIFELEQTERKRSGINSLKVRFNKVFGFYIEISKSNLAHVPADFIRKQTLVNGERYITPDLKKHEEIVLNAEDKINSLENSIFLETLARVLERSPDIQDSAEAVAQIDCILNFSFISRKNSYNRPKIIYSGGLHIKNGRHPVVENLLEEGQFVPNDLEISGQNAPMQLITGPNMAGKSVFIRQIALIVLMAQIGCFVPAQSAHISLVDRIFVRSGASDVITSGLSTFMVEMVETAYILNNATLDSLIVMDEIGRGTSTYDGISIAWAVAEYLAGKFKTTPKTLFATHYHELQKLEEKYPHEIKNYSMAVAEHEDHPVFLYTMVEGGASSSFGVAVARLAGIPEEVIASAEEKLKHLETKPAPKTNPIPIEFTDEMIERFLLHEFENLEISEMTPLEALNKLADLKNKLKLLSSSDRDRMLEIN